MNNTQATFAETVKAAALATPQAGRFGDNKAFIHAVWVTGRFAHAPNSMSLEAFKTTLVAANQARQLDLSRADMVEAMDAYDVRRSNTSNGFGGTFNFVVIN